MKVWFSIKYVDNWIPQKRCFLVEFGLLLNITKIVIFHLLSVHGNWTDYERWTACKKGQMTGYRFCTNPEPQNGGQDCIGSNKIIENCTTDESPGKSKIT